MTTANFAGQPIPRAGSLSSRLCRPLTVAEACGCAGYFVDKTEDFADALEQALNAGRPALIHVKQSLADIAPGKTLTLS